MISIYRKKQLKRFLMNGNNGIKLYYQLLLILAVLIIMFFGGDIIFQIFWILNIDQNIDQFVCIENKEFVKYIVLHYRLHTACMIFHILCLDMFFDYVKSLHKKIYCNSLKICYIILFLFYLIFIYIDCILLKDPQIEFGSNPIRINYNAIQQFGIVYIVFNILFIACFLFSIKILRNKIKNLGL